MVKKYVWDKAPFYTRMCIRIFGVQVSKVKIKIWLTSFEYTLEELWAISLIKSAQNKRSSPETNSIIES